MTSFAEISDMNAHLMFGILGNLRDEHCSLYDDVQWRRRDVFMMMWMSSSVITGSRLMTRDPRGHEIR